MSKHRLKGNRGAANEDRLESNLSDGGARVSSTRKGRFPDDLDQLVSEVTQDPAARGAFEDAQGRRRLVLELTRVRVESRIRQGDLAGMLYTTQAFISDLESGKIEPTVAILQRYARALSRRLRVILDE